MSGVNGLPSGQARGGASPLAPRQAARGPPSKPPDQGAGGRAGSHKRTPGVDMMGYVVRRTYTIVRGSNFVRIRRQFLRAARELDALGYVPWWRARTLCADWGQLKYTDSIYFCQTYDVYRIFKAARRSVAWKARKEAQRGAVCQAAG